jgi:hypothetical protein
MFGLLSNSGNKLHFFREQLQICGIDFAYFEVGLPDCDCPDKFRASQFFSATVKLHFASNRPALQNLRMPAALSSGAT